MADETLYARLGEQEAIGAVVDEFYDRVLSDDALTAYFEDADTDALREHQTQFLCSVTGGPVEWDGEDMQTAHADLGITTEDFGRVAEHLQDALLEFDVPATDREAVLDAVASYQSAIVASDD